MVRPIPCSVFITRSSLILSPFTNFINTNTTTLVDLTYEGNVGLWTRSLPPTHAVLIACWHQWQSSSTFLKYSAFSDVTVQHNTFRKHSNE